MIGDDVRRTVRAAQDYLADAEMLSRNPGEPSDADYLLQLPAFEIRLKALLRIHSSATKRNHSYGDLFQLLPRVVQARVMVLAQDRMAGRAAYSDLAALLTRFGSNCSALRYAYEAYEGMTATEVQSLGEAWVAAGAPTEEATLAYFPEELFGLSFALQHEIDRRLSEASPES